MRHRLAILALALSAAATFTATAPADACAANLYIQCGNGGNPHAGETCITMTQAGYPSYYCWSPALGWHWH